MNIREMDPHPSIWVFTAVAVCVTAITLMAALYHFIGLVSRYMFLVVPLALPFLLDETLFEAIYP
jgi:hypothetical protein